MPLLRLSEKLKSNDIAHTHFLDTVIEKIHLHDDIFIDVIKHVNGKYKYQAFLKDKPHNEMYNNAEVKKLKERVAEKVAHLNSLNLGIQFNHFGIAEAL